MAIVFFDPPYRSDIDAAINEEGVDSSQADCLTFVYQHGKNMEQDILRVLSNHPLDREAILPTATDITVRIDASWPPPSPAVECANWPRLTLTLPKDEGIIKDLYPILCHEFTHVIDRLNPQFGLGIDQKVPPQVMSVWHCSIDGRLARKGIAVPHKDEVTIDPGAAQTVSECERPDYAWLVGFAQQ